MEKDTDTGNGNGTVFFKLGTKTVGITSRDLISILLIILIGIGGYFEATSLVNNQQAGLRALQAVMDRLVMQQVTTIELINTNRHDILFELRNQSAFLQAQSLLVAQKADENNRLLNLKAEEQARLFTQRTEEMSTKIYSKFDQISRQLTILNYNIHRAASEQFPLDGSSPGN